MLTILIKNTLTGVVRRTTIGDPRESYCTTFNSLNPGEVASIPEVEPAVGALSGRLVRFSMFASGILLAGHGMADVMTHLSYSVCLSKIVGYLFC